MRKTSFLAASLLAFAALFASQSSATALTAPPDPPTSGACSHTSAGWAYQAGLYGGGYWSAFDVLDFSMCVYTDNKGHFWGSQRLSSPASYTPAYNHFTGVIDIWLQKCALVNNRMTYSTLGTAAWTGTSGTWTGTLSSGRYYFPTGYSNPVTTTSPNGYRVMVMTASANVFSTSVGGGDIALAQGLDSTYYYYGSCIKP
jgi:hypothetical protein